MKITNPTDTELNEAFAEKVAGWRKKWNDGWLGEAVGEGRTQHWEWYSPEDEWKRPGSFLNIPLFTTSADAVLPHAKKFLLSALFSKRREFWNHLAELAITGRRDWVSAYPDCIGLLIMHDELPRTIVIALLRAHGVEVEITK